MIDPRERTLLRAGRLRLAFADGRVQWLSVGGVELVRRIYVALRDDGWTTVPFVIRDLEAQVSESAFELRYDAEAASPNGTFAFGVELRGDERGTLEITLRGEARTILTTNRVGLCLHYPHELAGSALRWWRADDPTEREALFPETVVAAPPLKDLGGVAHPVDATTWCRASFHGDVFEMEDQRNFGDASFKVYSTPSDDPIPRVLQPGDRVEQRIVVELVERPKRRSVRIAERRAPWFLGAAALERATVDPGRRGVDAASLGGSESTASAPVVVGISRKAVGVMPHLGTDVSWFCASSDADRASDVGFRSAAQRVETLGFSTVRLELDLADAAWPDTYRRGVELAQAARSRLDLVLRAGRLEWPEDAAAWLARRADRLAAICVAGLLDDRARLAERVRALRRATRSAGAEVPIGAGTSGWFIDVNGVDLPVEDLDFVAYGLTPQVHVFDDDAMRENLYGIEPALRTASSLVHGGMVRVGPVTLRPRGSEAGATEALWPSKRDPRLDRRFGAVWTLGAIARLGSGGAAAATLFEIMGPEAIVGDPHDVGTIAGAIHALAPLAGRDVLTAGSSSPLDAFAVAIRTPDGGVGWLANPTERNVSVDLRLPDAAGTAGGLRRLEPYGIDRFAWHGQG